MRENLTVNGFHFDSAMEYAEAKHEADTINCICSRMDITNPEISFKVYCKLLDRNTLHTIVGMSFLKKLRDNIIESGIVEESALKFIHAPSLQFSDVKGDTGDEDALEHDSVASEVSDEVNDAIPSDDDEENTDELRRLNRDIGMYRDREKKLSQEAETYRTKSRRFLIIIIALIVVIGILFSFTISNNNFADKEIELQNQYAEWAEELDAREKAIEQFEAEHEGIELNY